MIRHATIADASRIAEILIFTKRMNYRKIFAMIRCHLEKCRYIRQLKVILIIRKHRKELPAIYETPTEIELVAGVADTEEGKAMHEKYEQVRYGEAGKDLGKQMVYEN